jgi:hypothetical protein
MKKSLTTAYQQLQFTSGTPYAQSLDAILNHDTHDDLHLKSARHGQDGLFCRLGVNTGYKKAVPRPELFPVNPVRHCLDFHLG